MNSVCKGHYPEIQPNNVPAGNKRELLVPWYIISGFDYVRETLLTFHGSPSRRLRSKRPTFGEQHQIYGYLVASKTYGRSDVLVWWHKTYDRDIQRNGPYALTPSDWCNPMWRHWGPCEAVAPERMLSFFGSTERVVS